MADPALDDLSNQEEAGGDVSQGSPLRDLGGGGKGGGPASSRDSIGSAPELVYDQPGNEPSGTAGKSRGLNSVPSGQDLAAVEKNGGAQPSGEGGATEPSEDGNSWYRPTGVGGLTRVQQKWLLRNRKKVLGGGVVGAVLGLVLLLSVLSGPLQFIQFGELLKQFHFASLNSTQDNRFLKEVRLIHYAKDGHIERTRMGYLGNKLADKFETKLNTSGLKSGYSPRYQLFDGYVVDRENSKFKGMSDDEIKQFYKEQGIDVVDGSILKRPGIAGELVVKPTGKYFQDIALTNFLLKDAGVKGLPAAIGTRLLCVRAGCTLHPLKKLVGSFKSKDEQRVAAKKQAAQDRFAQVEEGVVSPDLATNADSKNPEIAKAAADQAAQTNEVNNTGKTAFEAAKAGDTTAVDTAKGITFKGGAASSLALTGIACIARSLDQRGAEIKQAQVRLPLIRTGIRMVAIAEEIKDGKNIDPGILAAEASQLHGATASVGGKDTSWSDSGSIQTNLGHPGTGVGPDDTLKNLGDNTTPFHSLNSGTVGGAMSVVCNQTVLVATAIIGFLGGGIADFAKSFIQGAFAQQAFQYVFTRWASNQAVDPNAVGADLGNYADYGTALAANDQSIAAGGVALQPSAAATLSAFNNSQYQSDFNHQSLLYKLFNTHDQRTIAGGLVNKANPSPTKNIAGLATALLNIGHNLGSLSHIFTAKAQAATTSTYDYGFPTYGFSEQELSDPAFNDPYKNAGTAEALLSGPSGASYQQRTNACFGVQIALENVGGEQQWGVTSGSNKSVDITNTKLFDDNQCGASDTNWKVIRFFILDTETMNSMACYEGDGTDPTIEQACTDIGFTSGTSASQSVGPNTYVNPLRDVKNLSAQRVDQGVDYGGSGPVYALGNGTLVNTTNGGWAVCVNNSCSGPNFIVYQLSDGPAKDKYVYVAENCDPNPKLQIGQTVGTTTVLCTMVDAPPHIETGWANGAPYGAALSHGVWGQNVDNEDHFTVDGQNFSDLLQSLGAPPGNIKTGALKLGNLDAGLPSW